MAKGKRKVPDINSSSTADIAFLLLIFFLITTSMDTDKGLTRQLPPPPEKDQKDNNDDKIKERNILQVYLNLYDQLMVNGEIMDVSQLRDKAKEFIANKDDNEKLPAKSPKEVEFFGTVMVTDKHVVSLQNDRASSYQAYMNVQNELVAAYNELRDELAMEKWGKKYADLAEEQKAAIREIYPQKISEAEPKKYGEKK